MKKKKSGRPKLSSIDPAITLWSLDRAKERLNDFQAHAQKYYDEGHSLADTYTFATLNLLTFFHEDPIHIAEAFAAAVIRPLLTDTVSTTN